MPPSPARKSNTSAASGEICLGHINGVFGVCGEVRLFLYNPTSTYLFARPRSVRLVSPTGERRSVTLQARSGAGERVLARLEGVGDRDLARSLQGWKICVYTSDLPTPEVGEYYHYQLLGLSVFDSEGHLLGQLTEIFPGEIDIWQVGGEDDPLYFPALQSRIQSVDLDAGRVVVRLGD